MTDTLWRPPQLGSNGAWYRADDRLITITSGKVQILPDRSGNARDASQGTAGNRPVQVTGVVNSLRPVVRFTAASSNFLITSTFSSVAHPITYWVVAKLTTQGGIATLFNSAVSGPGIADAIYAPDVTHVNLYGEGTPLAGPAFNMTSAFTTYVAICNGASSSLRINGSQVASGTVTSTSPIVQMTLGSIFDGTAQYIDGDLAEVGFTAQALSGAKLTLLERYLRRRYKTW